MIPLTRVSIPLNIAHDHICYRCLYAFMSGERRSGNLDCPGEVT